MTRRKDIVAEMLELIARALASEGTFTEQIAVQIEAQLRGKYGGEQVRVWKTSDGKVGRPAGKTYDQKKAYADGLGTDETRHVIEKHGISRRTLYRLMKRGPKVAP